MKLRISSAALALLGLLTFTGCKDFFNVNVDPIHPTSATPEQLLPGTQVALGTYLGFSLSGLGQATSTLVGQLNSGRGVGSFQQSGSSFSNQWGGLYQDMLVNNELIIKQCTAPSQVKFLGVAQLQKAYTFSIMVDMWGEIPYSQALNGTGTNPSDKAPRFDDDRDIYFGNASKSIEGLFTLIDKGIANVKAPGTGVTGDIIYRGDMLKWEKFGNTLKLKLYNQIRNLSPAEIPFDLNAAVTTTLTKPMLQNGDDFELPYGSSFQPENRNISFLSNYVQPSREDFINRDFFATMILNRDPRVPFYFYNQAAAGGSATDDNAVYLLEAANSPTGGILTFNFATVKLGSTGQLASSVDNSRFVTLPGLYPSGGRFDLGGGTTLLSGADFTFGRGVVAQRMLTVASRYFTEAELHLTLLNQPAAAKAAYTQGVREAFLKLDAIGKADGATTTAKAANGTVPAIGPATPSANTYINGTSGINGAIPRYDRSNPAVLNSPSTTNEQKLDAIMYEKYVAGFGTGPDLYTDYRRTRRPVFRLPGEVPGTVANGGYPRRLYYDVQEITSNRNAPREQAGPAELIFWDK